MSENKFNIRERLKSFEPSIRSEKRQKIVCYLNINDNRFSTIINLKKNVKYDFTFTQVIFIANVLECHICDLYNTKVIIDYKSQITNNLVNNSI